MKRTSILLAVCSLMYGCAASGTFTYTADTEKTRYSSNCNFKVLSTLPKGSYDEIGVINVKMADYGNPRTPIEFKDMIKKDICDAGGDLVIGDVNGYGIYIRGTVFKKNS